MIADHFGAGASGLPASRMAAELPHVRRDLAEQRQSQPSRARIATSLRDVTGAEPGRVARSAVTAHAELVGYGVLQGLMERPGVTDVLVNAPDEVYFDEGGGLQQADIGFDGEAGVRALAVRLASRCGQRLDDAAPFVDGNLPGGVRLHAMLPPLAARGTTISLRVAAPVQLSLADLVAGGSMPQAVGELLAALATRQAAVCVSGGTGSGKTTLLTAMLAEVPATERICVVEDARELTLPGQHAVYLVARRPNVEGRGEVTLADVVRQALRMRPDRLVVGECRGAEVRDMLMAMNTGHAGGCTTVHANSVVDVPRRLVALSLLAGLGREAAAEQLRGTFDVVVHTGRRRGRRGVHAIGVLRDQGVGRVPQVEVAARCEGADLIPGHAFDALKEWL